MMQRLSTALYETCDIQLGGVGATGGAHHTNHRVRNRSWHQRTSPDGSFEVEFTAKPDPTVDEGDEPTFTFSVYTDVTDTTGETRSGNYSVQLGYTTLNAN